MNERNEKPQAEIGAGPREQAIRNAEAFLRGEITIDYSEQIVRGLLDALRPEEPPPQQFHECDTCRAKPGSPLLCASCQHNRDVIVSLRAQLTEAQRERQRIHHDYCETLAALTEAQQARDEALAAVGVSETQRLADAFNELNDTRAFWHAARADLAAAEATLASLRQLNAQLRVAWKRCGTMAAVGNLTVDDVLAQLGAALAWAGPTSQPAGWQLLLSCPRDGTNFLACAPASSVFYAHWANGVVDSTSYDEAAGGYQERHATHWMPMPEPVAASSPVRIGAFDYSENNDGTVTRQDAALAGAGPTPPQEPT